MSLSYETALKLKEAGFPQGLKEGDLVYYKGKKYIFTGGGHRQQDGRQEYLLYEYGFTCCDDDGEASLGFISVYRDDPDFVRIPSLSELIKECEDEFLSLVRSPHNPIDWQAEGGRINLGIDAVFRGEILTEDNIPEEAVANLYIALNKKDA